MQHFDLAPLYRATIGFDNVAAMMDRILSDTAKPSVYPPYNIEKISDNRYRISIAAAGFRLEDLAIEVKEQSLVITGQKPQKNDGDTFLYRGIASRTFEHRFRLADHLRVLEANHADGMLHIELVRELPEALKPRRIEIASAEGAGAQTAVLDG
ncbi:MAG: Hsp20 family protein [Rhodobacteraceae bacterium]|nr:Hsp20 family protein [Paracoccaceae bacterium]